MIEPVTELRQERPAPRGPLFARRRTSSTPAALWIGATIAVLMLLTTLVTLFLPLDGAQTTDLAARLSPPGPEHPLGTDQLGRDMGARLLSGFAWSLGIGGVATILAMFIGIVIGILGGWYPGIVRAVLNRVIDIGISFPFLVVAVTVVAVVGRGFWPLALTLGTVSWPTVARVVYAETLSLREREFIVAAKLIGVRGPWSILTHLLPALRPTLQVIAAFTFADLLVAESGLSFLGLGAPLGDATWGNMLADSRAFLASAPWMMLVPATVIVLAVLSANLLGDGLSARDRLRNRRGTTA